MDIKKFRQIVALAVDDLPEEFRKALNNIEVIVEDWPTDEELDHFEEREGLKEGEGDWLLLGLYQGVPLGKRDPQFYNMVLPDRITLFRESIEELCGGDEVSIQDEIRRTLLHEVRHYFGMDDEKLRKLGY
ncbi:MAG: metallopeptidase family protein [Pseudomonadota bacterium]